MWDDKRSSLGLQRLRENKNYVKKLRQNFCRCNNTVGPSENTCRNGLRRYVRTNCPPVIGSILNLSSDPAWERSIAPFSTRAALAVLLSEQTNPHTESYA